MAPQKVTRRIGLSIGAPPARAPTPPSRARNSREAIDTVRTSRLSGTMAASASGRAAPTAKVAAEVRAAWIGRAVVKSEMPSSSRAWAPRASLADIWTATCRASPTSTPRAT